MDTFVGGDGTDEAIDALEDEDGGEGVGEGFLEGPAAGDVMEGFAGGGGHCVAEKADGCSGLYVVVCGLCGFIGLMELAAT